MCIVKAGIKRGLLHLFLQAHKYDLKNRHRVCNVTDLFRILWDEVEVKLDPCLNSRPAGHLTGIRVTCASFVLLCVF